MNNKTILLGLALASLVNGIFAAAQKEEPLTRQQRLSREVILKQGAKAIAQALKNRPEGSCVEMIQRRAFKKWKNQLTLEEIARLYPNEVSTEFGLPCIRQKDEPLMKKIFPDMVLVHVHPTLNQK